MRNILHHRRGFTLVELLATMALIVTLLSIAVAVSNSATMDSYKINGAADKLSQTLITAKARAARDKAPRGVRLIASLDPVTNATYFRELVYIEQPDPWLPDQSASFPVINYNSQNPTAPFNNPRSQLVLKYPQNTTLPANTYPKPVPTQCQAYLLLTNGDYNRLPMIQASQLPPNALAPSVLQFASGAAAMISSPDIATGFSFSTLTPAPGALQYAPAGTIIMHIDLSVNSIINPDLAAGQTPTNTSTRATFQTTLFGIYPPAQPLAGEPSLILSKNAAVDAAASLPQASPAQNLDILFAPAGHVMFHSEGVLGFLVRDTFKFPSPLTTPPNPNANWLTDPTNRLTNFRSAGEMILVTVYPRTGTIATKPVAEPSGANPDPYQFAKDALNAGL